MEPTRDLADSIDRTYSSEQWACLRWRYPADVRRHSSIVSATNCWVNHSASEAFRRLLIVESRVRFFAAAAAVGADNNYIIRDGISVFKLSVESFFFLSLRGFPNTLIAFYNSFQWLRFQSVAFCRVFRKIKGTCQRGHRCWFLGPFSVPLCFRMLFVGCGRSESCTLN